MGQRILPMPPRSESLFLKGSWAGTVGQGIGGGLYIASGTVCLSKNTVVAGNIASTSNPDIFGLFTIC